MLDTLLYRKTRGQRATDPNGVIVGVLRGSNKKLTAAEFREWPTDWIAYAQANPDNDTLSPFNRKLLEAEIKRRELWDSPAATSAAIAFFALIVATAAAIIAAGSLLVAATRGSAVKRGMMNSALCRAAERDMLSAKPRRSDAAQLFAAMNCQLSPEAHTIFAPPTVRKRAAGQPLPDGGYSQPARP